MSRVLVIFEVSQKQAYIFASNKLKENIQRSAEIAYITSSEYVQKCAGDPLYIEKNNLVYSGGGHTILEFPTMDKAKEVIGKLTRSVMEEYPDIELFTKAIPYDETMKPGENVKKLTAELEKKKSLRAASFFQRSFGVEKTDVNTGKPIRVTQLTSSLIDKEEWIPEGYLETNRLDNLGSLDEGFISVVHIDGNAMGKRVEELTSGEGMLEWTTYKQQMAAFSTGIADDFRDAYVQMQKVIGESVQNNPEVRESLSFDAKEKMYYFPVRQVIAEGDDICFVANGKLGIEAAVAFINALAEKTNPVDKKQYAACAGVALVHQKYPFYRAYELAEELCSNAKRFGAGMSSDGSGSDVCCVDWHIEFGELKDTLDEVRKQYITADGNQLEMRPYIVTASTKVLETEPVRQYKVFRKLEKKIMNAKESYGRRLIKGLRPVLKDGESAADYYLRFHKATDILSDLQTTVDDYIEILLGKKEKEEYSSFVETADGKKRSVLFDAIEIMDNFSLLEDKQE